MRSVTAKGSSKAARGNMPNHQIKKRNRKPLSCASCRTRKLRCDRSLPACGNCISRSEADSCDYSMTKNYPQIAGQSAPRSQASRDPPTPEPSETPSDTDSSLDASDVREEQKVSEKLRQKLERLELLIGDLMDNHPTCGSHKECRSKHKEAESGHRSGGEESSELASSSHNVPRYNSRGGESMWSTLLTELAEVRAHIFKEKSDEPIIDPDLAPAPTLLFGAAHMMTQDDMLRQLPSRQFSDDLIEIYFTAVYPSLWFLHRPTFMEEYRNFWANPRKASIVWLALLFGIFRVALSSWIQDASQPDSLRGQYTSIAEEYRHRTVQCLAQADCTRPQPHVVEALLLHLYAEYTSAKDLNPTVWIIHATVVRISMKMGYHIPSISGLTPFHIEIRKRIWAFIRQADILISFQVGLPSMLHGRWLQGELPLNINDDEFSPSSTALPQPLPDSQMTPVSYLTSKARLALVFAEALQEADKSGSIPYAPVASLDGQLRSIYENMPQTYRDMDVSGQVVENAGELTARIVLASIYNKALCVLHARYLDVLADSRQIVYSRLACVHSAMNLIACQELYNRDVIVRGKVTRLSNSLTSMTLHDFFLAATLLCKALFLEKDEGIAGVLGPATIEAVRIENPGIAIYTEEQIMKALDSSVQVFDRDRIVSAEAGRACDLLSRLLQELRDPSCRALRRGDWPFTHAQDADWLTSTRMQLDSSSNLPEAQFGVDPRDLESWSAYAMPGIGVEENEDLRVTGNAAWSYYTS